MNMREIVAALLLLCATNVQAFQARPVANLRFDGRITGNGEVLPGSNVAHIPAKAASDGTNFLLLLSDGHVYAQSAGATHARGPQRLIGRGAAVDLIWTGDHYLAAWDDGGKLLVAPLSRDGTPLAAPRVAGQGSRLRLAANQDSALAFAATGFELSVQPLDVNGLPTGSPVAHVLPSPSHGTEFTAAAPVPGGFALVTAATGTWMMRFHADGTAMPGPPLQLDPAADAPPAIASDGTDTLVLLTGVSADFRNELRSVVVSAAGAITGKHAISSDGDWIAAKGLVWDGTQYTAAINILWDDMRWIGSPALLHLDRSGQRTSDIHEIELTSSHRQAYALATNGHDLIVPAGPECVVANAVSLQTTAVFPIGRTLTAQDLLRIAAGRDGYVAAWRERSESSITIRATRISPWGDYQDGDGVVLQTHPSSAPVAVDLAVDAYGPRPLVVWSANGTIFGRFLPGTKTFAIAAGDEVVVRWDGTRHVVLFTDGSLKTTTISPTGVVGPASAVIAATSDTMYQEPQLALVAGHLFAFAVKHVYACGGGPPNGTCETFTILGRRLDSDAAPFVIAGHTAAGLAVAESPSQALVSWMDTDVRGAFVSGDGAIGTSFPIDVGVPQSAAFDGTNFVLAGEDAYERLMLARISPAGAVGPIETVPVDDDETMHAPVVAANATFAPLIVFRHRHPAYDWIARGSMFFLADRDAATPPNAPVLFCATKNSDDTITARWQRVIGVLGYSIELQLSDGTFRAIGVAPAYETSARVSLAGLDGDAIRVRAWNAAGLSAGSSVGTSVPLPAATLRASQRTCANTPATITIFLTGSAPFTVTWDDGVVQTNLQGSSATRTVQVAEDRTFTILSVADASCGVNTAPESIRIDVDPQPVIDDQTHAVTVTPNQTAKLTVSASDASQYSWFEGTRGDTSHPVGRSSATFTTPPLTRSTRYWVRVSNRCGSTDSETISVGVSAKRRAARR